MNIVYSRYMAHTSAEVLRKVLDEAATKVAVGARYAHYRNPDLPYRVLSIALLEADEAPAVVYQAEYGEQLTFVRPLTSFLEEVGDNQLRFIRLEG